MRTLLTFPGHLGDTFLQWQAARTLIHYQPGEYVLGLGTLLPSMKRLIPLFERYAAVPVQAQELAGITEWGSGGQPWDFGMGESVPDGFDRVLHCGYREHPILPVAVEVGRTLGLNQRQLDSIPRFPGFVVPGVERVVGRLVFHCPVLGHTGEPAMAWRLLETLLRRYDLQDRFDILVIGLEDEVRKGRSLGLQAEEMAWERTAEVLAGADAAFCGGSSVAALAGCLHTPCVRLGSAYENNVHFAFRPWTNVAPNQLNVVISHFRLEDLIFDFLLNHRRQG